MTLEEIKQAIEDGKKVYWASEAYDVIKDSIGQYLISCNLNGHCIGLTWRDGVTLNGKEEEFFVKESVPLVSEEVLRRSKADCELSLDKLMTKRNKSKRDLLSIEYLKTFIGNPTPLNYILLTCGRAEEMKRKGDV